MYISVREISGELKFKFKQKTLAKYREGRAIHVSLRQLTLDKALCNQITKHAPYHIVSQTSTLPNPVKAAH